MRNNINKITLAAIFWIALTFNAFAANLPGNCIDEIMAVSKGSGFDMQKFMTDLPIVVAKAKLQARAPFGQPKDSDKMSIGMSFGCLKAFPESPGEIQSLLKDLGRALLQPQSQQIAMPEQYQQPQPIQPQYIPPQVQPEQYQQPLQQSLQQPLQQPPQQCQCHCYWPQQQVEQRQQFPVNMEKRRLVQNLIEEGLKKNKKEIQMEAAYLSQYDREDLYDRNEKKHAVGYAFLSGSVGLGLGSYIQGNTAFGIVQSIADALGLTMMIIGVNSQSESYSCSDGYCNHEYEDSGKGEQILAMLLWGGSRIAGFIAPFVYQSSYNKTLRSALNVGSFSYSFDPLIIPKDKSVAVGLAFNVRY